MQIAFAIIALSQPFVGAWSMSGWPPENESYITCADPIHIEAVMDDYIRYLPPSADPALENAIQLTQGETTIIWEPIDGGPSYEVVWTDENTFALHDKGFVAEAKPFIYRRCS